jgi:hypothetical protein
MDCMSSARSLSLLDNLMLKQRHGQSLTDYVHCMRQTFDDYNKTCQRIDGSAAIHSHNLGQLMLRGISSTGPFGQAKQCVINAFETENLMSADEVMDCIVHLTHNMDEDTQARRPPTYHPLPSLCLSLLVAVRTAVADTTHVALIVVVASPTSAAHVAAWTTYCPPALPQMTPFSSGPFQTEDGHKKVRHPWWICLFGRCPTERRPRRRR